MIAKLKIGILGSGQVAKVLGAGFVKYGYHVMVGTRDANKLAEWKSNLGQANAEIGSFADAIAFGDIILLAVKGVYAEDLTRFVCYGACPVLHRTIGSMPLNFLINNFNQTN